MTIESINPRDKTAWVHAAQAEGKKLAVWAIEKLNLAAAQPFPERPRQP